MAVADQDELLSGMPEIIPAYGWFAQCRVTVAQTYQPRKFRARRAQHKRRLRNAAVDTFRRNDADMRTYVVHKLRIAQASDRRSKTLLGRIYNSLTGEAANYIQVSGAQVVQICEIIDHDLDIPTEQLQQYRLRRDFAERAILALDRRLNPTSGRKSQSFRPEKTQ